MKIRINSLKNRLALVIVIFVVISMTLFAFIIFTTSEQRLGQNLSPQEIQEIIQNDDDLLEYASTARRGEVLAAVAELIREEERERAIKSLVLTTVPITILAGIAAYFISIRLIKPFEDVTTDISNIDVDNLDGAKLQPRCDYSEITVLVDAFNELLIEVQESFESQERFIQDASHELRTPLAAIQANIQLINENSKTSKKEDYIQLISVIERLNKDLIRLNDSLLFLERNDDLGVKDMEEVSMSELVLDIIEEFQPKIIESGVNLSTKVANDIYCLCVPLDIVRAIRNILDNAFKYNDNPNPSIQLRLSKSRDNAIITVVDNGPGIPKSEINQVTERFYRGNKYHQVTGSGLGLSIVQKIVDNHGGTVKFTSPKGKGTKVVMSLPRLIKA